MAVLKLSQIASAGSPPALTDTVIGVGSGTTDLQYTLTQIKSTVAPVGANPSATASNTAVNGSAATFMRSDGAPAIQLTSSSVFGLCKVDNTTITASAGVITAIGGSATSITINSTSIVSGTTGRVLYDNAATIGEASAFTISSGQPNVASGSAYLYNAAFFAATDSNNGVYIGPSAGNFGTLSGASNVCIGLSAGNALTSGASNVLVGKWAGGFNASIGITSQSDCVVIGDSAGFGGVPDQTVAIGAQALARAQSGSAVSGSGNTAVGYFSLRSCTSGTSNVAIGNNALGSATTASTTIAIGPSAMGNGVSTGSGNIALGSNALLVNTSGTNNFAMGTNSLSLNTTGVGNTAIGTSTLANSVSTNYNVAIGNQVLQSAAADSNNTGVGSFALDTVNGGSNNTCVGWGTGQGITTGGTNLVLGYNETTISSGSGNIAIGNAVGVASATASNQLVIGNYIYGTGLSGTGSTISSGKIGIGTKAPAQQLEVAGNCLIDTDLIVGTGTATNATSGFLYVDSGAGTPTGTPSGYTGTVPMYIDTTNSQLWLYLGGAWKQPKTPAGAALITWQ